MTHEDKHRAGAHRQVVVPSCSLCPQPMTDTTHPALEALRELMSRVLNDTATETGTVIVLERAIPQLEALLKERETYRLGLVAAAEGLTKVKAERKELLAALEKSGELALQIEREYCETYEGPDDPCPQWARGIATLCAKARGEA